jgi:hypothetical protein
MRTYAARVDAGSSEPLETTDQQRLEKLERLAEIFADIFSDLPPEHRANFAYEYGVKTAA